MIEETQAYPIVEMPYYSGENACVYCYTGSTAQENAQIHGYTYYLLDEDSLLLNGEEVPTQITAIPRGTTVEELQSQLTVDGISSRIEIGNTVDDLVCTGTTITLMNTEVNVPGNLNSPENDTYKRKNIEKQGLF